MGPFAGCCTHRGSYRHDCVETLVGTGTTNYHPGFINGLRENVILSLNLLGLISGKEDSLGSEQVFAS